MSVTYHSKNTYRCPLCQGELQQEERQYRCPQGHSFDLAKEGYVNLLPVNQKKSKDPGDNKEMMFARRAFLNAGYCQALSDRINELAIQFKSDAEQILDLGCGEGYYTDRLMQAYQQTNLTIATQGLDISKAAIRFAAKRYPEIGFCVASSYQMPYKDNSFDFMLRVYAPSKAEELARVMKSGGILMTVSPGAHHHSAIKQMIYEQPRLHEAASEDLAGFQLIHQENLQKQLILPKGEMVGHFLNMTPYAWKLNAEKKQQLTEVGLSCELDFLIQVHQRQ